MSTVALWLVPAAPWQRELGRLIAALAHAHGSEAFEPHVTLHVADVTDPRPLPQRLDALASRLRPIRLQAGETGHGSSLFKTLFVSFDDTRLHELQALGIRELGLPAGYDLNPHLSLLYRAGLNPAARDELARRHDLRGQSLRFDRLALVRPASGAGWSDIAGWQILATSALGAR